MFEEYLRPYPKCRKAIHLTQPDMQGPFDSVDLMSGGDVFYDLYDEPEMIHEALNVVSDTMVAFQFVRRIPIFRLFCLPGPIKAAG